jgi:4-hydroxy-2-oxoheptanedioate aldolase
MKSIRERALAGEVLAGTYCNLGSSLTVEIAGRAGFDWILIDLEHGAGDFDSLVPQLQAAGATPAAPIVRIAWNESTRFKRVLDLGASGIMVPHVSSTADARLAAASMRYPPHGIRGAAAMNRACGFGSEFDEYFRVANDLLLTVVMVETAEAINNLDAIAAVDGVDVLFVGPLDLSISMEMPKQYEQPQFREALDRVVAACRSAGKAAGIHAARPEQIGELVDKGFTFLALGSDGNLVAGGMKNLYSAFDQYKQVG